VGGAGHSPHGLCAPQLSGESGGRESQLGRRGYCESASDECDLSFG
jgi:hypothetical protein